MMEKYNYSIISVPFLFVMGIIIGVGNVDNIAYGDTENTGIANAFG